MTEADTARDCPRNVKAGEVLLVCEPWIANVCPDKHAKVCSYCWKWEMPDRLNRCTGCGFCYYCDKTCQKGSWQKEHKHECLLLKAVMEYWKMFPNLQLCLDILLLKALNRYALNQYGGNEGLDDKVARDYFIRLLPNLTWDRKPVTGIPNATILSFVSASLGYSLTAALTPMQIAVLWANIRGAKECIQRYWRNEDYIIGCGMFMERTKFGVACRGNSSWTYSGSKLVVKALVDINGYAGLHQITVTPDFLPRIPMMRDEMKRRYEALPCVVLEGFSVSRRWTCRCHFCSPSYEAEMNPVKCITKSCMEPIPSDERALLPCPQCGADNKTQLSLAKTQIANYERKIPKIHVRGLACGRNCHLCDFDEAKKLAILLKEMEESLTALHPDNVICTQLVFKIVWELGLLENREGSYPYFKKYFDSMEKNYLRFSEIDPQYAYFLSYASQVGLDFCGPEMAKLKPCARNGCDQGTECCPNTKVLQEFVKWSEMRLKGQQIMKKFCTA